MRRIPSGERRAFGIPGIPGIAGTALGLVLALLLPLAGVERHSIWEAHGAEAGESSSYVPSAAHPHQARHLEASSSSVERPTCALCVHSSRIAGAHLAETAGPAPAPRIERLAVPPSVAPLEALRSASGARGPPSA
jgi:hypothetical protein